MHFLIDGYNLLHALGLLRRRAGPDGLHKARTVLLGLLAGTLGERAKEAVVIFDAAGAPAGVPHELEHRGIQVYFAQEEEQADDLIEKLIRTAAAPRQLTVVSNDHRLVKAARRRSCTVMKCEEFLESLQRQPRRPRPQPTEPKEKAQGLSKGQTDPWFHDFADLADDPAWKELFPFQNLEEM